MFKAETIAFHQEMAEVVAYRERLWEVTRVCSRCSTVYLSERFAATPNAPEALPPRT